MAIEIERKFLVNGDAWRAQAQRAEPMRQGYLGGIDGKASVRVRLQRDRAWLNIKAAVLGSRRAEYEYPIPLADAAEMLDSLCVGLLEKTRYYVEFDGFVWEVDEFHGANAGLVVAEIELDADDQAFARPDWVGREITDERRYYNHALALQPFRDWKTTDTDSPTGKA